MPMIAAVIASTACSLLPIPTSAQLAQQGVTDPSQQSAIVAQIERDNVLIQVNCDLAKGDIADAARLLPHPGEVWYV